MLFEKSKKHLIRQCISRFLILLGLTLLRLWFLFELNFDSKLIYSSKDSKQKRLVQYVLNKIEAKSHNNNILLNNISIEHIYPENPKDSTWVKLSHPKNAYNITPLST